MNSMYTQKRWFRLLCICVIGTSAWLCFYSLQDMPGLLPIHSLNTLIQNSNSTGSNIKWIITTQADSATVDKHKDWSIILINKASDRCGTYSRSNLLNATLTTINEGAKYIYLTSVVDNQTFYFINRFKFENYSPILKYNGSLDDPVSAHFIGVKNNKLDRLTSFTYNLGVWKTPSIQKVLQQNEIRNPNVLVKIDSRAPPIVPESGSFPFIKHNLLFLYEAFWSIVPIQDINLWSLWTQRLLQELDCSVSFITTIPSGKQCQSVNASSKPISEKLAEWTCESNKSFFACIRSLNRHLLNGTIIDKMEVMGIGDWMDDLIRNGYQEPIRVPKTPLQESLEPIIRVIFHPTVDQTQQNLNKTFSSLCPFEIPACPDSTITKPVKRIADILLLVVFNWPNFYQVVDYLEKLYRPVFSQILFCGMEMKNYLPYFQKLTVPISFVEMTAAFKLGQLGYKCLEAAMKMNYDVQGYLHLGDDVLFNMWNIQGIPTDKIWFQQNLREAKLSQIQVPDIWKNKYWWPWENKHMGRKFLIKTLNTLNQNKQESKIVNSFLKQLNENSGGVEKGFYEACDIVYIPHRYSTQFVHLIKYFSANKVYFEIAILYTLPVYNW